MKTRLERKKLSNEDLGIVKGMMGLMDLFDNGIKSAYRLTDEMYDTLAGKLTDDEMDILFIDHPTFAEKRQKILILNKYI